MNTKKAPQHPQWREKADGLIAAAVIALEEPLAKVAGFKSAGEFKAEIIRSLGAHPEFDRAARDLHGIHSNSRWQDTSRAHSQVPSSIRPHGGLPKKQH
jgi:molybdopterin biosynthesis enzyme